MTDVQSGQIKRLQAERRRQAEQIGRLQRAMRKTIEYNYESVEDLMAAHILLPGDMEARHE